MLKIFRLTKAHKGGYQGYKWAIDFINPVGVYDVFPRVKELLDVRMFCEQEFGPALEYEMYYALCSYGTGMTIPPNPHWTYDFSPTARQWRAQIYVSTDEALEKIKEHFGVK